MIVSVNKDSFSYRCMGRNRLDQECGKENTVKIKGIARQGDDQTVVLPACECGAVRCLNIVGVHQAGPQGTFHTGYAHTETRFEVQEDGTQAEVEIEVPHSPEALDHIHTEAIGALLDGKDHKAVYKKHNVV